MRSYGIVLMLLVMMIACSLFSVEPNSTQTQEPTPHQNDAIMLSDTQEVVTNMRTLCCKGAWWDHLFDAESKYSEANDNGEDFDIGVAFLANLETADEKFDPNEYFKVLTHLALEDGYALDYVYSYHGGDGFPGLYARPEGEPPFENYPEYQETNIGDYLDHIQVDGTAEGYFELTVLRIMGGQFYLSWHAEYNDWEVVGSQERLKEIIEWLNEEYSPLTKQQVKDVMRLDVTPRVQFEGNKVIVKIVAFTKWGGFFERVLTIDQDFPHQMIYDETQLFPYECGIVF